MQQLVREPVPIADVGAKGRGLACYAAIPALNKTIDVISSDILPLQNKKDKFNDSFGFVLFSCKVTCSNSW